MHMRNVKKIIMVLSIVAGAFLMTNCGKDREEPNFFGNQGNPCGNVVGNFQGFNSFYSNGNPNVGQFLQANPNSAFQYGNSCYTGSQLYQMYTQYGQPWNQFQNSPYGQFQFYNPYGQSQGSYNYSSSNSYNMNGSWTGAGDFFGGNPFMRYPKDQWSLNFYYYDNDY